MEGAQHGQESVTAGVQLFGPREAIHKCVDSLLRNDSIMKVIDICERNNKRPDYCVELLFDKFHGSLCKVDRGVQK